MGALAHRRGLGLAQFINANVLFEYARHYKDQHGGTIDDALSRLYRSYRGWCSFHFVQDTLPEFTQDSLHVRDQLRVGGKAAANRSAVGFSYRLAEQLSNIDQKGAVRFGAVWGLKRFYDLIYQLPMFLTDEQCASITEAMSVCLLSYHWLALKAMEDNRHNAWRIRPKWHMALHLCELFATPARTNPRAMQCYRSESFMGLLRRLVASGHKRTLPQRALERYLLLVTASRWMPRQLQEQLGALAED